MRPHKNSLLSSALALTALLAGCQSSVGDGRFSLSSTSVDPGSALPSAFSCEGKAFGKGVAPELHWSGAPVGTKSYVIIFKDVSLQAAAPEFAYHWAIWDIPASAIAIPEGLLAGIPSGALAGATQLSAGPGGEPRYFGPCPSWQTACPNSPARSSDHYSFTIYAMDVAKATLPGDDPGIGNRVRELEAYFEVNALAQTELNVTSDASPATAPAFCP